MDLIKHVGFDQSFSFIYSARPGTPAAELNDDTPRAIKQKRLAELQACINEMTSHISADMVGSTQPVLVDGKARKDAAQMSGRTDNNRVVNFPASSDMIGQFVNIEITEALPNSLRGRVSGVSLQQPNSIQTAVTTVV